jgi:hypothetical protein
MFSTAADARKRPAKCAIAHEQADDKVKAVLLNSFFLKKSPGEPGLEGGTARLTLNGRRSRLRKLQKTKHP